MSTEARTLWTSASTAAIRTGTWRVALPEYLDRPAPCHRACPVDGDIAEWIRLLSTHDYRRAWLRLIDNNPFPAVTGRVCHRPCESSCNRGQLDEPVAIRCLERFLGDTALDACWAFPETPQTRTERIAVVGGGPAGLAAAYHLRRAGFPVELIEAMPALGGVLRYGIPPYRLPRSILDAELDRLIATGIEVTTGVRIDDAAAFEDLRQRFDAIFVAVGAGVPKRLPKLDYSMPGVMDGSEFLRYTNDGEAIDCGRRVVVIGGGSAAMDVARSAKRLGSEVVVLCLEKAQQMPAQAEEIAEAGAEGITIIDGSMLQSVVVLGAKGLSLECVDVDFEPGADGGGFDIRPIPGTNFTVDTDLVVTSIGQDPDTSPFAAALDVDGGVFAAGGLQETGLAGVFTGGDAASTARFVTEAFAAGKRAAAGIDAYCGARGQPGSPRCMAPVSLEAINTVYQAGTSRVARRLVPAMQRVRNFNAVEIGLAESEAAGEAARCFSCGNCTYCDNCFNFCPDMAILKQDTGYSVNLDYCKGCGLCAAECPTGSIAMRQGAQ